MTSILSASGFNNLESLLEFATRFPNVNRCLDSDLQKIWICHKNPEDIPKFEEVNSLQREDITCLLKKIKRKIAAEEQFLPLLTEFTAVSIFDKIYSHFNNPLTSYIFTKCYVFYNWGINAFEPVIDHFEIHKKIDQIQKNSIETKKNNHCNMKMNQNINREKLNQKLVSPNQDAGEKSVDLFEDESGSNCSKPKVVSFQSVKSIYERNKKYFDLAKNPNNPYQETFELKRILYDMKQRPQWPKNHVLSKKDVEELLMFIIKIPVRSDGQVRSIILEQHKIWLLLRNLLGEFLKRHEAIDKNNGYGRILKKHLKKGNFKAYSETRRLLAVPKSIVGSYIVDILRRVLPFEFFGCNSIRKRFFSSLIKILNGTKEENFIWLQLLGGVLRNKSSLSWCGEMKDNYIQTQMLLKLFKFVIINYVFVLIKNNFYVTETGSSGYSLQYYRKGDMESASSACLNGLLFHKHVKLFRRRDHDPFSIERKWLETGVIDMMDFKRKAMKIMSPGTEHKQMIANVRFLPKNESSNELRLITNIIEKHKKSHNIKNKKLLNFFKIRGAWRKKKLFFLKLLLDFLVDKIGFGIKPVPNNPKLEAAWSKAVELKENFGKLYFVKADIAEAFDSVNHDVLMEIIQRTFDEESLRDTIQLRRIIEWQRTSGRITKAVRFSFSNRPKENCIMISRSIFLHHKIKLNQNYDPRFIDILKQVVTEQRIEIKGKIFKLIKGLAQGSAGKFSPKLCEIYYSSMDRWHFKDFLSSNKSVLLRGVDDYLFITSDEEKAKMFLEIVQQGIERYNVRFNNKKLKSNLMEDIQEVPYLGLIFNFSDMSVRPNYSKHHGRGLLSTMKLNDNWGNNHFNKERFLERRALRFNSLKLQPILLSKTHNTLKTIKQNVFQACVLQAFRVMTLAQYLYQGREKNDLVVFKILLKSCNKIKNVVFRACGLSKDEIKWLFFYAVLNVFRNRSGQFKSLLVIIKYHFQKCERTFVNNGLELFLNLLKGDILDREFWRSVQPIFGKAALIR